ncbi:sensor histidine kinase [Ottowia thiooxydans]|uniref:sensor histidine kinase n=1 Tax=Ottowia thiooxydans TaxID=219182 RepID=UPI00041E06F6|nr:hypothetical protein [Ottowia thiooxydans]
MQAAAPSSPSTSQPPSLWLFAALAYCLVAMALAVGLSLKAPSMGLRLAAGPGDIVTIADSQIEPIPVGARLISIASPARSALALNAEDVMEEPDMLPTYDRLDTFLSRQDTMAGILTGPTVELQWQSSPKATPQTTVIKPRQRGLSDLPLLFWFQIAVSIAGCLIACWVWVLRPQDWGARMFGITGLAFPVFVMPAAIYSTRELALPGSLFQWLSQMNYIGTAQFGVALGCIFLLHPKPLVRPVHIVWPFVVFNLWCLADFLRLTPSPHWGRHAAIIAMLLQALTLAALQWHGNRGNALARASLRWLSLSLLAGSGLFILLIIATAVLGWLAPLPQGYAFGFFLLIYVGIALGLRRYRLFDLDEWAWRMLLWIGGALAVVGVDALLIVLLDWSAGTALGASLWICGALYFPARQWLWQRVTHRPALQVQELMPDVVRIAFQPSRPTQETLWDDLLRRIHDPMQLESSDFTGKQATLNNTGLTLEVPACGGIAARRLSYASRGQRLFSSKDAGFLNGLCQLMDQAQTSRDAYERGASEERRRIARDMHDDVGARLLMLIHRAGSPELAELARAAMHDLRTALHVMDAQDTPLADAIADWRAEAGARCEAAQVALIWSADLGHALPTLPSRQKAVIERALREGLTNALRHARPNHIEIAIALISNELSLTLRNDGAVGEPSRWVEGRGLQGMRHRLQAYGGELHTGTSVQGQAELMVRMPLLLAQEHS